MKTIAFTWTAPALLAQAKTVTRRLWKPRHAARFRAGDFILAYDKSPRAGGRPIALLRLAHAPYLEPLAQMPDSDFEAEGIGYLDKLPIEDRDGPIFFAPGYGRQWFEDYRQSGGDCWVVRFAFIASLLDFPPRQAAFEAKELAAAIEIEERQARVSTGEAT